MAIEKKFRTKTTLSTPLASGREKNYTQNYTQPHKWRPDAIKTTPKTTPNLHSIYTQAEIDAEKALITNSLFNGACEDSVADIRF